MKIVNVILFIFIFLGVLFSIFYCFSVYRRRKYAVIKELNKKRYIIDNLTHSWFDPGPFFVFFANQTIFKFKVRDSKNNNIEGWALVSGGNIFNSLSFKIKFEFDTNT